MRFYVQAKPHCATNYFCSSSSSSSSSSKEWKALVGDVGQEPPLPKGLYQRLVSPSPFFHGLTIKQTSRLVLIPKEVTRIVDGKSVTTSMTLKNLGELIKPLIKGSSTIYSQLSNEALNVYGDTPIAESYWVLLTKTPIPDSQNKTSDEQKKCGRKCRS